MSIKKIILSAVVIVVLLALVEIVALLNLKRNIKQFSDYWKNTSTEGEFTYVALGDSAAQGLGASSAKAGYVGQLARRIEQKTGKKVRIVNLSVSGAKIVDVLNTQVPQLKNYKADLVTLDIGGNDIRTFETSKFTSDFEALTAALPAGTFVADIANFGGRIKAHGHDVEAGVIIAGLSRKYHLQLVGLYDETKRHGGIFTYASDLFHPSTRGYTNWTNAYWKVIEPTI